MPRYDVIIVGARIAGSVLAMRLADAGVRVLLVDKARFPSDVVSSAFLWPPTVSELARLGILKEVGVGLPPLRSWIKFLDDVALEGTPPWPGPEAYNLAPMRIRLDAILLNHALNKSQVDLWSTARVVNLISDKGRVTGVVVEAHDKTYSVYADWVIGADGRHSRIARLVNAPSFRAYNRYRAWFVAYLSDWEGDSTQVVTGMQGEDWIGVTPTYDRGAIASLSVPISALVSFKQHPAEEFRVRLNRNAFVAERLGHARFEGRVRGAPDLAGWLREPVGPGWALVGDAGAHVDPIAATGIGFSLLTAEYLSHALTHSDPASGFELATYRHERDALYMPVFEATNVQLPTDAATRRTRWKEIAEDPILVDEHFTALVEGIMTWFNPRM